MRILTWFMVICGAAAAAEPAAIMPDGARFKNWADATRYSRTYHVSADDRGASDENPGTAERPFRTIDHAAQMVRAGERVVIHSGVYRELVRPRFSGEAPDRMIAYEAAPGEEVVLRGSRVVRTKWERSRNPRVVSKKVWMTALADEMFANGDHPFRTPNASNEELDLMPWATEWKGRVPYSLPRGLLFQDGRRLTQLASYDDVARVSGSYWVASDGKTVHAHPFGDVDPNGVTFEATAQEHIIQPRTAGLAYIRISGLTLEQCANGIPRVGVGALFTMGGHHWIIERNTVRHVNSVGIEIGYRSFEDGDTRFPERTDPDLGHNIVRGNRIYDCGTAGIRGHTVSHALVEDNDITDCGWQDAEFHWETAGIKLLINTGTLVRNNHIARIMAGGGIWLDWDNRNARVTGNVIHDIQTVQGAVFVEASQQPNVVDHNFIWNVDGQGIRAADTDHLTVAHNLFGRVSEALVLARVATDRALNGRPLTSTHNRVVNNIFIDAGAPLDFADASNTAEYNVYLSTDERGHARPLAAEAHSVVMSGEARWNPDDLTFSWKPAEALPRVPGLRGEMTVAGPSPALQGPAMLRLGRRDLTVAVQ